MKKILVAFDDDLAKELDKFPNMSEIVRQATRLYIEHIPTDMMQGIRASYQIMGKRLVEMDKKLDYIAKKLD